MSNQKQSAFKNNSDGLDDSDSFLNDEDLSPKKDIEKTSSNFQESEKKDNNPDSKKSKKLKFPSSLLIIVSLLFIFILFTWIIPHEPYTKSQARADGNLQYFNFLDRDQDGEILRFGILDSGFAIFLGFYQAIGIIVYLFTLGAILEILIRTETFERTIGSSLNSLKNKELILVPILFVMFSLFGTIWGMQEETLAYYTIMVPFMVLSGFTPTTAILIMMVGNTTGIMASVTNPFSIGVAISASNIPKNVEISLGTGILIRLIIWFFLTSIGAVFVTHYAWSHSQNKNKNFKKDVELYEKRVTQEINLENFEIKTMKRKHIISMTAFGLIFLIFVIGLIPWNTDPNGYGFGTGFISSVWSPIGHWGFAEMSSLFFFGIIIQILIHGPRKYNWTKIITDGAKGMLTVSIIIAIARGSAVVLMYSGLSNALVLSLTNNIIGEDMSVYLFLIIIFIISLIIGMVIPSTSGSATLLFPILSGVIFTNYGNSPGDQILVYSIIAYSLALGMANMITPAQPVVLTSIDYSGLTYNQYLKTVGVYLGIQTFAIIFVVLPIISLI